MAMAIGWLVWVGVWVIIPFIAGYIDYRKNTKGGK